GQARPDAGHGLPLRGPRGAALPPPAGGDRLRLLRLAEVADEGVRLPRLPGRRRGIVAAGQGRHPAARRSGRRVLRDRPQGQGLLLRRRDGGQAARAHPAPAVRGAHPGGRRLAHHRARDHPRDPQGRALQVLRRRHQPQAQAAGEAEGGQEAHEDGRQRRGPAGGVHRGAVVRRLLVRQEVGQEVAVPAQPDGEVPPLDGGLPQEATARAGADTFSAYVHVPYCRVRCGYCDFNTYTADELGAGANREDYREQLAREIAVSRDVLAGSPLADRAFDTVFFGGGTPTLLPAEALAGVLDDLRSGFGLAADAEVTTEANPDSVDAEYLTALADAGFTRVSFGMQSAVPHVLRTLDRTHDPARIGHVVRDARAAGLAVSLDLIYGTPGESLDDWRASLAAVLEHRPDHVSAYSLIVEPGTRMGVQVRRGELPMPDEDDLAEKYELADSMLAEAGLTWYEVSNFSTGSATRCEHNLAYWRNADWWGYGPGAHSHVGGVRW